MHEDFVCFFGSVSDYLQIQSEIKFKVQMNVEFCCFSQLSTMAKYCNSVLETVYIDIIYIRLE